MRRERSPQTEPLVIGLDRDVDFEGGRLETLRSMAEIAERDGPSARSMLDGPLEMDQRRRVERGLEVTELIGPVPAMGLEEIPDPSLVVEIPFLEFAKPIRFREHLPNPALPEGNSFPGPGPSTVGALGGAAW